MNEAKNSLRSIFNQAVEITDGAARAAFLNEACGQDAALRQRVDALLHAHQQAGGFLDTAESATAPITIVLNLPLTEKPGDWIGRYKLLQQIGEGGCGVVYMAEQQEPVVRRVAVKVIKLGMDTKTVVARFEAERQALAMMDHPNIAKVLDAGATETGRPFFVMELVRGIKITDYCDQNKLSTRDRLSLFVQVCQAIQHAHQKGIIHRDIKPSNILITLHDGVPVPKVIDFGIAKATQGRLTDQTLFTAFEQFIGTPAYMSPEQAEMSGLDVDTRSDIYALGVLLYELLTGKTPFDATELMASGLDKMRQTIREQEPVRPSTRLNTMLEADLTTTVKRRQTDAPKLVHLLRGDLDWIVMKCLEKDRTRRFETANGVAMDIQRYLNNEAIVARPPSRLYRFQKMVRRNKVGFVAGGSVIAALVIGAAVSTVLFVKEHRERIRADQAERLQASLRADAEKGRELMKEKLKTYELQSQYRGVEQLLTTEHFKEAERLFKELPDRPESVPFYLAFGNLHSTFGPWNRAVANFTKAIEYEPSNFQAYLGLGNVYAGREEWQAAITNFLKVTEFAPSNYDGYDFLGPLYVQSGNPEAYQRLRELILSRFGATSDPNTAERASKDCLMLPSSSADLAAIDRMADTAVAAGSQTGFWEFFQFAKGLAEYRQGNFAGSSDWMQKVLASEGKVHFRDASAYAVLAMSRQQLKQFDLARSALAKAREIADKYLPKFGSHNLGGDWKDYIIAGVLLREAEALVEDRSTQRTKVNGLPAPPE
jgi:tetratricopeptide (TPR) repeat protein/tRNA A-37 threonylcarbamoyl transferase component Bud32